MAQQVKWGVLGAASIAVQRVIPAMREAPSATFLALASRDESKARAVANELGAPRPYAGYEQLLADPDLVCRLLLEKKQARVPSVRAAGPRGRSRRGRGGVPV